MVNSKYARAQMLSSWTYLNEVLRTANEALCRELLNEELNNKRRPMFVRRIHGRLNKMRTARERTEFGLGKLK